MWSGFYATNTIIYFLKKFSFNDFILLNLDKIKDLVCFQTTCDFNIILTEFIIWPFFSSGKCLRLRKLSEISDSFRNASEMFKNCFLCILENFLKIFGNLRKSSEILKIVFLKVILRVLKIFWKIHNTRGPYKIIRPHKQPIRLQETISPYK